MEMGLKKRKPRHSAEKKRKKKLKLLRMKLEEDIKPEDKMDSIDKLDTMDNIDNNDNKDSKIVSNDSSIDTIIEPEIPNFKDIYNGNFKHTSHIFGKLKKRKSRAEHMASNTSLELIVTWNRFVKKRKRVVLTTSEVTEFFQWLWMDKKQPFWINLKNPLNPSSNMKKFVVILFSGLSIHDVEKYKDICPLLYSSFVGDPGAVDLEKARSGSGRFPVRTPGSSKHMHSDIAGLLNIRLNRAEQKERRKNRTKERMEKENDGKEFPGIEYYLISKKKLFENGYPFKAKDAKEFQSEATPKKLNLNVKDEILGSDDEAVEILDPLKSLVASSGKVLSKEVSNRLLKRVIISEEEAFNEWVETKPKPSSSTGEPKVYAMDCEMVTTTQGLELARVSVVDKNCNLVYDTYVKPREKVLDYHTQYSGITENHLSSITFALKDVQRDLTRLFDDKTILIGHSLENDLVSCKLFHSRCIDTSLVFPHQRGWPFKPALKVLAKKYCQMSIQSDENKGHDSVTDATACMKLMNSKLEKGPEFGSNIDEKVSIFELLGNKNISSSMVVRPSVAKKHAAGNVNVLSCESDKDVFEKLLNEAKNDRGFVFAQFQDLWEYLIGLNSKDSVEDLDESKVKDFIITLEKRFKELLNSEIVQPTLLMTLTSNKIVSKDEIEQKNDRERELFIINARKAAMSIRMI